MPELDVDDRTQRFLRLLAPCEQDLRAYVLSLLPNWDDAEEVMQETYIRLWEQFDQYDPAGNFAAWARTIAFYLVLQRRSKQRRSAAAFSQQCLELLAAQIPHDCQRDELRRRALRECLARLSAPQRDLLRRCYAGDRTIKQVAAEVGRSVRGTQKSVARLRAILHECIARALRKEDWA